MMKRFVFPWKMPSANEYINACRINRYAGGKMKADEEQKLIWAIREQGGQPLTPPLKMRTRWYEKNKRRDHDNIVFSKKFILDSLQKAGVIGNDNWGWISGFEDTVLLAKDHGWQHDYVVVVELEEVNNGTE